jgi:hypothetical protein
MGMNGERLAATAGGALVAGVLAVAASTSANATTIIIPPHVTIVPRVVVVPRATVVPRPVVVPHVVEVTPAIVPHALEVIPYAAEAAPHPSSVPLPIPAPRTPVIPIPQAAPRPAAPSAAVQQEEAVQQTEESRSWFSWPNSWAFWQSSTPPTTSSQVIEQASKALDDHAPIGQLRAEVDARLAMLHDAVGKLDALQAAIDDADGLDADARQEAIRHAGKDFDQVVEGLDLSVDPAILGSADPDSSADEAQTTHKRY